jgi:hypothetical protein
MVNFFIKRKSKLKDGLSDLHNFWNQW